MSAQRLRGCELWPVPGFSAMGVLATAGGLAPVALAGPKGPGALVLAGQSLELVRGLAAHAARQGLSVLALLGRPGRGGAAVLEAAMELAGQRGASAFGLAVHGGWAEAGLRAADGAELVAVLDPERVGEAVDPLRLRGRPLWIATGTEACGAARALHARARHPRALIELLAVPRLEHAVSDVAGEMVPFIRHGLAR